MAKDINPLTPIPRCEHIETKCFQHARRDGSDSFLIINYQNGPLSAPGRKNAAVTICNAISRSINTWQEKFKGTAAVQLTVNFKSALVSTDNTEHRCQP